MSKEYCTDGVCVLELDTCVVFFPLLLMDLSVLPAHSGLLEVFCKCLLENLERLPGDARTMVGVLTYDSSLHFYNLNVSG